MPSEINSTQQIPQHWEPYISPETNWIVSSDALELTEHVSKEELKKINELDEHVRMFTDSQLSTKDGTLTDILSTAYASLKDDPHSDWNRDSLILATGIIAMKKFKEPYASSNKYTPIDDLTISQKLLLVRVQSAIEKRDMNGLIAIMRAGEGKTTVIPAILPLILAYYDHCDVTSLSPTKRSEAYEAFKPIAQTLGISICEFHESSPRIPFPQLGARNNLTIADQKAASVALSNKGMQVTFAIRGDIIHHFENHPDEIPFLDSSHCATIADEIDRTDVDEASQQFIIASEEQSVHDIIESYWSVFKFPDQNPDTSIGHLTKEERIYKKKIWTEHCSLIKEILKQSTGENIPSNLDVARSILNQKNISESNELWGFAIMRSYLSEYQNLKLINSKKLHKYILADGSITLEGHTQILNRLYRLFSGASESEKMNEDWEWTLSALFPAHITQAIDTAIALDEQYFIDGIRIVVKDRNTGYPKPHNEFSPLIQFALYAKESITNTEIQFPDTLHETTDMMTSSEFLELRYGFTIGLTGTGESVARFFEATQRLASSIIPPTHEDTLSIEPIGIFLSKQEKYAGISKYITEYAGDNPVIISVEESSELEELRTVLLKEIGASHAIQTIDARDASDIKNSIERAGMPGVISISRGILGREITVPTEKTLYAINASIQEFERNAQQFAFRAGRFGKLGVFKTFTSIEDVFWRQKIHSVKESRIRLAFSKDDTHTIQKEIEDIWEENERKLLKLANTVRWKNSMRVDIRKHMNSLPEISKKRVRKIWPTLITVFDTAATQLLFSPSNLDEELKYTLFTHDAKNLYFQILSAVNKVDFEFRVYEYIDRFMKHIDKRLNQLPTITDNRIVFFAQSRARHSKRGTNETENEFVSK